MARGLWYYLARLPPIDWEALAADRWRLGQKGPQPKHWNEKRMQVRKENARRRSLEASQKRAEAVRRTKAARRNGIALVTLLWAMEPGHWYGASDLRHASGLRRGSVYGLLHKFLKLGWARRIKNPEGVVRVTPDWLYGLTEAGERERARRSYLL